MKGVKKRRRVQKSPFYNHLLCLGEGNVSTQAVFLACRENIVLPLGYPRNDLLIDNLDAGCHNPFAPNGFNGEVVFWMPTFRASINPSLSEDIVDTATGLPLLATMEDLEEFNVFFRSINLFVIVKIHHLAAEKPVFKQKFSNMLFVTDDDIAERRLQLYQILGKSDALLSDYSSVAIDYLLTNKPMGFILDDMESYAASRGAFLFEDVKTMLAGYHIYDKEQLKEFFREVSQGMDSTKDLREKVMETMIKYPDNKSCERIARLCNL